VSNRAALVAQPRDFDWLPWGAAKPWDKNPRLNAKAVDPVARSIARWGFVRPITIWLGENRMVCGHTCLKAFEAMLLRGYQGPDGVRVPANPSFIARGAPAPGMVPVRFHEFDTEDEADAYALADNKLGEIATWDDAALAALLAVHKERDAQLPGIAGWSDQELARLLTAIGASGPASDDDEAPEPSEELLLKWPVELGQVWELPSLSLPGQSHRVMCGDSESEEAVKQLLAGAQLQQLVTDPPYGVRYDPMWREEKGLGKQKMVGKVHNDDKADWSKVWALWPAPVAYIWHAGKYARVVEASLESAGYEWRAQIIWHKQQFQLSRGHYHFQHEPCFYMVRKGARSGWCGDRKQSTSWDIPNLNPRGGGGKEADDSPTGHGTQKPKECMARPMRNHHSAGAKVGDPFLGSGTGLIAAERERRICYGMELGPAYLAAILERAERAGLAPRRAS